MKITTDTPDRLVVDSAPWALGLLIVAVLVAATGVFFWSWRSGIEDVPVIAGLTVAGGIVFLLAFIERNTAVLDRSAATLTQTRRTFAGARSRSVALGEVERAELAISKKGHEGGHTELHRLDFVLESGGRMRFMEASTRGAVAEPIAARVNAWLGA